MGSQPSDTPDWPPTDDGVYSPSEKAKSVFEAEVALVSAKEKANLDDQNARSARFRALADAERAADLANLAKFFDNVSTLSVGAVERARAGAEVVQKASAAIVALYTGILAFVFAAGDNPLPARGVLAPVFLALAVVLSTAYLGYVTPSQDVAKVATNVSGVEMKTYARLNTTTAIASTISTRRSYWLRASVLALAVGLVCIVLPFVSFSAGTPAVASASTAAPAWPTPTPGIPDALNAIVYKAQVDEIAAARNAALEDSAVPGADNAWVMLLIGAIGLGLTFGVPAIWEKGTHASPKAVDRRHE